jgi:hypothetical protein
MFNKMVSFNLDVLHFKIRSAMYYMAVLLSG